MSTTVFDPTPDVERVRQLATETLGTLSRPIGAMPLAASRVSGKKAFWGGPAQILGSLLLTGSVSLLENTLCRRVVMDGDRATGVDVVDLTSGTSRRIHADAVIVAADTLRTPQLLWASGIRPAALGHNLNDQPQVVGGVRYLGQGEAPEVDMSADVRDRFAGVTWVPYDRERHPFHGQILQLEAAPIAVGGDLADRLLLLSWFLPKDIRSEDRVEFSSTATDRYGMPAMRITYGLSEEDLRRVENAKHVVTRLGLALGWFEPSALPRLLPAGSSMHYQGTVRMGRTDDGGSVSDTHGRVWGTANVFVAGNGVIPTETACNPTATAVALAVRTGREIASVFTSEAIAS
ncbi:GMC oxidoreductase [Leifsonia sp. NPDC058194]|uniref:GMC oxidoreductase n=1 Tax=Leifsonia sp. NPDC058194 TaxID=3346374 RepID=UPI0036DD99A1